MDAELFYMLYVRPNLWLLSCCVVPLPLLVIGGVVGAVLRARNRRRDVLRAIAPDLGLAFRVRGERPGPGCPGGPGGPPPFPTQANIGWRLEGTVRGLGAQIAYSRRSAYVTPHRTQGLDTYVEVLVPDARRAHLGADVLDAIRRELPGAELVGPVLRCVLPGEVTDAALLSHALARLSAAVLGG